MPDRDAFGRLVDEDPIEAMGWAAPKGAITRPQALRTAREDALGVVQARLARTSSTGTSVRRVQDAAARSPGGLSAAANESFGEVVRVGRSAVRARRSHGPAAHAFGGARRLGGLLRAGAVLLVLAWLLPVGAIVDGVREVADRPAERPGGGLPEARPAPEAGRTAPAFTSAGFASAVAAVREAAGPGARPTLLRVDEGSVTAQVLERGGGLRTVRWAGGTASAVGPAGPAGGATAFAWRSIDARAPARLAARIDGLRFAVLLAAAGDLRWSAFDRSGAAWLARADGRAVRRGG